MFTSKTLGICIALTVLAVVAVTVFQISVSTVFLAGALLACPLLHIAMMGGHKNHK